FKVDRIDRLVYFQNGTTCLISRNKVRDIVSIVDKYQKDRKR
ncbi:DNA-binding response regulator, partial [Streptococcus agalactiae]|nr:DNA-binding response regulator [Streptococcus agalactiae]